jgi:hypothetical protein
MILVIQAVGEGNEECIDIDLLEWPTSIQQATYVLLLHNAEVELWAESSVDVICEALLELADNSTLHFYLLTLGWSYGSLASVKNLRIG